jgi:hypothetical protein
MQHRFWGLVLGLFQLAHVAWGQASYVGTAGGTPVELALDDTDDAQRQFVDSGFAGVSLEFDAQKQRLYERNSCCAGSSVTTAEYKVVRNKMVLVAQHCYRWDEKRQALLERPASACQ